MAEYLLLSEGFFAFEDEDGVGGVFVFRFLVLDEADRLSQVL